jgi:uncharacterized protein (DUF1330 family)
MEAGIAGPYSDPSRLRRELPRGQSRKRRIWPTVEHMPAYAIAHLWALRMGPDIVRYVEQIDSTLEPFGGRFLVHGADPDVREGELAGDVIVVEFPDRATDILAVPAPAT